MHNRIVFKPYKNGLGGLGLIKEKLKEKNVRVLEIKKQGSKYVQKRKDLVINWGVQHGGKLNQLNALVLGNVACAEFTTEKGVAEEWLRSGIRVLCRTLLNGHGGAGIVVAQTIDDLVAAPLYVKYVPKKREFRVHCVKVSHEQWQYKVREKRRREGWQELEGFNKHVRNHDNGWMFCDNLRDELPPALMEVSRAAVEALALGLGAVDIGFHMEHGYCVYEVNTAPGCDNATAEWYAQQFMEMM